MRTKKLAVSRPKKNGTSITVNGEKLYRIVGESPDRNTYDTVLSRAVSRSVLTGVISVEVDKQAFKNSCLSILDISPVWAITKSLPKLSLNELPVYYEKIVEIIDLITASVEVSKTEILKNYPEGTKFSAQIALETAVKIFDDTVKFTGFVGRILDACDQAIIKLLINVVFKKYTGVNWVADAISILKLVVTGI